MPISVDGRESPLYMLKTGTVFDENRMKAGRKPRPSSTPVPIGPVRLTRNGSVNSPGPSIQNIGGRNSSSSDHRNSFDRYSIRSSLDRSPWGERGVDRSSTTSTSTNGTSSTNVSSSSTANTSVSSTSYNPATTAYKTLTARSTMSTPPVSGATRQRSRSASTPLPTDAPPMSRPLVLHPDFRGEGDVVLVCSDDGGLVGFRVSGNMLRMASPILAALLKDKKGSNRLPAFVKVTDSPADMHGFLRLLKFGRPAASSAATSPIATTPTATTPTMSTTPVSEATTPTTTAAAMTLSPASAVSPSSTTTAWAQNNVPPDYFPSIQQYEGIQRLALKYNGWYTRACIDFHVELRASEIVERVGKNGSKEDVFALARLAHDLRSSLLWAEVCERLRVGWWHHILNPYKFSDSDIEQLGHSIYSLFSILATVSSRPKLFSHLDEVCVLYDEEGDVSVAATDKRGCCSCGER